MLNSERILSMLTTANVNFFTGVPDSLLKSFCACITDKIESKNHIIACNEGAAIGLAIGHHLATKEIPLVYMQNSGLGNAVNPLLSLASSEVYSVPMLLLIGWRGEPGTKDEPQHLHQGRVTTTLLESMDVPYKILSKDHSNAQKEISDALHECREANKPFALLARKSSFEAYDLSKSKKTLSYPSREEAIIKSASLFDENDIIVATTGMISRELYEYRSNNNLGHHRDFLTVGGMGHASQIAMGISNNIKSSGSVVCFDGDGAILMHMGSLTAIGRNLKGNFIHIVFNNGVHDSVGGQPTVGYEVNLNKIAELSGYTHTYFAKNLFELEESIKLSIKRGGTSFIEIRVKPGNRDDLGRPRSSPKENKLILMENIQNLTSEDIANE